MEIVAELVNHQFVSYVPVVLVLVVAILLFTFGFKSAEQPPFDKLSAVSSEDRKQANAKKRKTKEKKTTANGNVTNVDGKAEKSPSKDKKSPTKESPDTPKQQKQKQPEKNNKKNEAPLKLKKSENVEDVKNKRNKGAKAAEKPVDFDDGEWETVPTKADKKKKQEGFGSPVKKERKKRNVAAVIDDKAAEIEKLAKEVVNKELRDKAVAEEKENVQQSDDVEFEEAKEIEIVKVEEKKKKEKKAKKEVVEKVQQSPPAKVEEPVVEQIAEAMADVKTSVPEGGVVFDELGDVWTEAKLAKKGKKKARRDN